MRHDLNICSLGDCANLRHGSATMDTLVSVGTLAAWLWSGKKAVVAGLSAVAVGLTVNIQIDGRPVGAMGFDDQHRTERIVFDWVLNSRAS